MRAPIVAAFAGLAIAFTALPAEACHGTVTAWGTSGSNCSVVPCITYYTVASSAGPGMVLALYQESNGLAGLQRGAAPLVQGGHDHCWQGPSLDYRIF